MKKELGDHENKTRFNLEKKIEVKKSELRFNLEKSKNISSKKIDFDSKFNNNNHKLNKTKTYNNDKNIFFDESQSISKTRFNLNKQIDESLNIRKKNYSKNEKEINGVLRKNKSGNKKIFKKLILTFGLIITCIFFISNYQKKGNYLQKNISNPVAKTKKNERRNNNEKKINHISANENDNFEQHHSEQNELPFHTNTNQNNSKKNNFIEKKVIKSTFQNINVTPSNNTFKNEISKSNIKKVIGKINYDSLNIKSQVLINMIESGFYDVYINDKEIELRTKTRN